MTVYAGDIIYASDVNDVAPLVAVKTADETVNNSSTLQDDNELFVAVRANNTYIVETGLIYSSGATPLIKVGFDFPSGATFVWTMDSLHNSITAATRGDIERFVQSGSTQSFGVSGAGTKVDATPSGLLTVGSTGGNFTVQWAQQTANASNTVMYAGSWIKLTRKQS